MKRHLMKQRLLNNDVGSIYEKVIPLEKNDASFGLQVIISVVHLGLRI